MLGLTVRWSLADAPPDADTELAAYVADSSFERFTGKEGLRFKTWRMRAGEWFEGCYVFGSDDARASFQRTFAEGADTSPVSQITGAGPILIEECDVVAVAEGGEGFLAAPRY
jgi:hypothetical protein